MTNPVEQPVHPFTESDAQPVTSPAEALHPDTKHPDTNRPGTSHAEIHHSAPGFNSRGKVDRTRVSGVWIGLIVTAIFLVVLIVFIAQNLHKATIHFFGLHGTFPVGLAILGSAIVGILLVAIPGTIRILQLRRALRKNVPADKRG